MKDNDVLWLTRIILDNYKTTVSHTGMPLGNWTSQFFANIYLNELDQFVKHKLKAKHYIRYVDDFVILERSKKILQEYLKCIHEFLHTLKLKIHPNKCAIIPLQRGVSFLGFRMFYTHRLVRQRNLRKIKHKLNYLLDNYELRTTDADAVLNTLQGWNAYAMQGNTYHLRQKLTQNIINELEQRTPIRRHNRILNCYME